MVDYDVIPSMDWLSKYNATILCRRKKVVIQLSEGEVFEYKGTPRGSKWLVVFAMKASRMLLKGCVGYLASIMDTTKKVEIGLVNVRVVCKFPDVFPEELPGLPHGMTPISKAPYRIALVELKELKQQLQELLDKKFIHPNYSL